MTDWSQLSHAYGNAQDISGLLEQAAGGTGERVWRELWSRLCHQGGVYSASYAAIPALTEMAGARPVPERLDPLLLAAAIVSSTDTPWDAPNVRTSHGAQIERLAALAAEALAHPGLASDSTTYVYVLQALLAFEGIEVWGEQLQGINDEEYEVPCPHCDTENFVAIGSYGYFTTLDSMYMRNTEARREPLQPEPLADLSALPARLRAQAMADGHTEVADKIPYVFGHATCADCRNAFRVDEAITARWG